MEKFIALWQRFICLLHLIEPSTTHIKSHLSAISTRRSQVRIGKLETENYLVLDKESVDLKVLVCKYIKFRNRAFSLQSKEIIYNISQQYQNKKKLGKHKKKTERLCFHQLAEMINQSQITYLWLWLVEHGWFIFTYHRIDNKNGHIDKFFRINAKLPLLKCLGPARIKI